MVVQQDGWLYVGTPAAGVELAHHLDAGS